MGDGLCSLGISVPSPGAEAFWLAAEDLDHDPLTYGISGTYAYFFNVTPATGEVKLAYALDYEVKDSGLGRPRGADRQAQRALGASVPGVDALPVLSP